MCSPAVGDPSRMLIVEHLKNVIDHYKEGNLRYSMLAYISLAHLSAGVGLSKLLDCSAKTLLWTFVLWVIR